jgi:hypothetical protein
MEGKCNEVFEKVAYIYNVGHALSRSWDFLQPDRRQESLEKLRDKLVELNEKQKVRHLEANNLWNFLDTLGQHNKGEGTIHDLNAKMDSLTEELAIHAIADCECAKPIV